MTRLSVDTTASAVRGTAAGGWERFVSSFAEAFEGGRGGGTLAIAVDGEFVVDLHIGW